MISDRFFKIFALHIKWGSIFSSTPFLWNSQLGRPIVTKRSRLNYFLFYVLPLAQYMVFLMLQIHLETRRGHKNEISFYYMSALTICALFDLATALTLLCKAEMVVATLRESFKLFRGVQRHYMPRFHPNSSKINWLFDGFVGMLGVVGPGMGLVIGLHCLIFPHWPVYFTSIFLQEDGVTPNRVSWNLWLFIRLTFALYYIWMLQAIWANLIVFSDIICTIFWYAWLTLQEFLCRRLEEERGDDFGMSRFKYRAIPDFRSFGVMPTLYNRFQILCTLYSDFSSMFIVPLLSLLMAIILYCNFSLITQWVLLRGSSRGILLFWSYVATTSAMMQLTLLGRWYVDSKRIVKSFRIRDWGSRRRNMEMKKFARSCRPLSFGYGRMYVIRRVSVLKYLKKITRGTLRALLTLK